MTRTLPPMTAASVRRIRALSVLMGLGQGLIPGTIAAQSPPPESIPLTGVIRDFRVGDGDFSTAPLGGNGHYAGNIALTLDTTERPVFVGGGFKVLSQWRDSSARPIAPHLASDPDNLSSLVFLVLPPTILPPYLPTDLPSVIDTFDPYQGPYGGLNVGPPPVFEIGAMILNVMPPSDAGLLVDQVVFSGDDDSTLDDNLHVNRLEITNDHTLRIDGNVVIVAEESIVIEAEAKVELLPCATLTIYAMKDLTIQNDSMVNVNTADPARLNIYKLGDADFTVSGNSHVYADTVSPLAQLRIEDQAHYYGSFVGKTITLSNLSGFHYGPPPPFACCQRLSDTSGSKGLASNGGIASADDFSQWFRDVMDRNLSVPHTIELIRNAEGVYEYLDDEFHAIDGRAFGNEGMQHNSNFTFALRTTFTHDACSGYFFEFMGADDAWAFLDGELVMDLGGLIPGTEQYVDLDRLNLSDGQTHTLHFFYAQRQSTQAVFRMRTNIPLLANEPPYPISAAVD